MFLKEMHNYHYIWKKQFDTEMDLFVPAFIQRIS